MISLHIDEPRKKILLFSLLLLVTMGIVFILATSLAHSGDSTPVSTAYNAETPVLLTEVAQLTASHEKLQARLVILQQLDGQYAAAVTDISFAATADSLNKIIALEELGYKNLLSEIKATQTLFSNKMLQTKFEKMTVAYQRSLENRQAISSLRTALAMQHGQFSPDEKAMLQMQEELQQKNNRITVLETTAAAMVNRQVAANEKNEQNNALEKNIAKLENTVLSLTATNTSLQQQNEKLLQQQEETKANAGSKETALKEKTAVLQHKIDALNAALQLARVDCNLSRVDALQIISNAKQRKQLLSEASGILSALSISGNDDIKRKAKEKIAQLNQVAANSRE
jgi:hypothetical protein